MGPWVLLTRPYLLCSLLQTLNLHNEPAVLQWEGGRYHTLALGALIDGVGHCFLSLFSGELKFFFYGMDWFPYFFFLFFPSDNALWTYRNGIDFCMLIFVSCSFTELLIRSNRFVCLFVCLEESLRLAIYKIMSSAYRTNLTAFQFWCPLFLFLAWLLWVGLCEIEVVRVGTVSHKRITL